jgi:hypothetical protein
VWSEELAPRSQAVGRLAYSRDGSRIAAAMGNNVFEVWDARTGDVMLHIPWTASAWSVRWTDRDELILIPLDRTIRLLRPIER